MSKEFFRDLFAIVIGVSIFGLPFIIRKKETEISEELPDDFKNIDVYALNGKAPDYKGHKLLQTLGEEFENMSFQSKPYASMLNEIKQKNPELYKEIAPLVIKIRQAGPPILSKKSSNCRNCGAAYTNSGGKCVYCGTVIINS